MEGEKLNARRQLRETQDIQHSEGEEQDLALCYYSFNTRICRNNRTKNTVSQYIYSPDHHSKHDLPFC